MCVSLDLGSQWWLDWRLLLSHVAPDRIESELASDVDATQSRSPNVTDWSQLFILCCNFVSCLQLIYFNISWKKKSRNVFHMAHMAATDLCYYGAFFWCLNFERGEFTCNHRPGCSISKPAWEDDPSSYVIFKNTSSFSLFEILVLKTGVTENY